MPFDASTYDDDRELTVYIWHNYRHLLTPTELRADAALRAEVKIQYTDSKVINRMLRKHWGSLDEPDVAALLADGEDTFRDHVRDRILAEHEDEVFINRCSKCSRVVATPRAKQCLWCGYDWHEVG